MRDPTTPLLKWPATDVLIGIAVAVIALVSHYYISPVTRQKVTQASS